MATISYDRVPLPNLGEFRQSRLILWSPLALGDDGEPVAMPDFADRTVQVAGTFGAGGAVAVEGSLDGLTWATLTDPQGNALSITAAKIEAISEAVLYVRPRVTGGDGTTSLTIHLLAKG